MSRQQYSADKRVTEELRCILDKVRTRFPTASWENDVDNYVQVKVGCVSIRVHEPTGLTHIKGGYLGQNRWHADRVFAEKILFPNARHD